MTQQDESTRRRLPIFGGIFQDNEEAASGQGIIAAAAQGGVGLGQGWANLPSGSFGTEDPADLIDYQVQQGAAASNVVEFTLVIGHTTSGWAKAIIMPDGLGSRWAITAQGRGASASNGLWADQVKNGQVLTFRKPTPPFGIWFDEIQIGFLDDLDPGDRVVFTWRHD